MTCLMHTHTHTHTHTYTHTHIHTHTHITHTHTHTHTHTNIGCHLHISLRVQCPHWWPQIWDAGSHWQCEEHPGRHSGHQKQVRAFLRECQLAASVFTTRHHWQKFNCQIFTGVTIYRSHIEILSTIDYVSSSCWSCLSNSFVQDDYWWLL